MNEIATDPGKIRVIQLCNILADINVSIKIDNMHADGEAVIMLAFQASGRGSTPLRRMFLMLLKALFFGGKASPL
jgi:hypothetical protein